MAKEKLPDRQCLQCGSDFTPKRADSNFCSKKCMQNAWYANRKKSAKVAARRIAARRISPAPVAESPHADPPLVVWLRLRQQLTDFEDANPDIRKQAARALKDLA